MEINKPVATVILIVINLILLFLFVVPTYQETTALHAKIIEKQQALNSESIYYANLEKAAVAVGERQEALEKIASALPEGLSLAPIVSFLQKKGSETGLIVKSVTFSQLGAMGLPPANRQATTNPGKEIKKVNFTVALVGNYQGLKNFISAVETSARMFEVDSISFTSSQSQGITKNQNRSKTYEFKLKLITHNY